jgi:YHS domain-containing protein
MLLKIRLIVIILGMLIFGQSSLSFAEAEAEAEAVTQATSEESVDVGNKICPVSGEKIDQKLKATYEYEGKIYNFCCPMCVEEFKKDPHKYIEKIKEEKLEEKNIQEQSSHEEHHHDH